MTLPDYLKLKMESFGMNYTTVCLLVMSVFTYILWFYKKSFSYWKNGGLENLKPTIPFGNAFSLAMGRCTQGELFAQQYLQIKEKGLRHAGTYFYWTPVYIPVDPQIIKQILISDFEYFPNHGFYNYEKDPLTVSLLTAENEQWRNMRTKFPVAFTSAKMRNMFLIMDRMAKQLAENLEAYAISETPVNIKSEITRFTADIICSCAFGIETNTMKKQNEEMLKHGRTFFTQWNVFRNSIVLTIPRRILKKFNFKIVSKNVEDYFLDLFQKIMTYRKETCVRRGDVTDILLRLAENLEERDYSGTNPMDPISFKEFTSFSVGFLTAGYETSSATQTFAFYELARNPDCQNKLRKEIQDILAKYGNKVTYEAVMEMKYLDMVVDETLRLYPILPMIPRLAAKDYKIPGTNIIIEKDTTVMISNMGIQRDPEYYPDPDKFDPERFSSENKAKRPFVSHLPFGEGPRVCVGKRFGLLQTKMGILTTVQKYHVSLDKKTSDSFKFVASELLLKKVGNVWLKLQHV